MIYRRLMSSTALWSPSQQYACDWLSLLLTVGLHRVWRVQDWPYGRPVTGFAQFNSIECRLSLAKQIQCSNSGWTAGERHRSLGTESEVHLNVNHRLNAIINSKDSQSVRSYQENWFMCRRRDVHHRDGHIRNTGQSIEPILCLFCATALAYFRVIFKRNCLLWTAQ